MVALVQAGDCFRVFFRIRLYGISKSRLVHRRPLWYTNQILSRVAKQ